MILGGTVELCKVGKITPKLMPIVAAALIAAACEPDNSSQSASSEDYTRFCATEAADGTVVRAPDSECKTTTHTGGGGASTFFLWYLLATRHGGYAPSYGSAFDSGTKTTPAGGAIYDAPAPGKSMRSGATIRSAPASTRGGFGATGSSKGSTVGS